MRDLTPRPPFSDAPASEIFDLPGKGVSLGLAIGCKPYLTVSPLPPANATATICQGFFSPLPWQGKAVQA